MATQIEPKDRGPMKIKFVNKVQVFREGSYPAELCVYEVTLDGTTLALAFERIGDLQEIRRQVTYYLERKEAQQTRERQDAGEEVTI